MKTYKVKYLNGIFTGRIDRLSAKQIKAGTSKGILFEIL